MMSAEGTQLNQSRKESEKKKTAADASNTSKPENEKLHRLRSVLGISESAPLPASFTNRVRKAYRYHKWQYWFVATLFNFLLALQIAIAATLTAIGNINSERVRTAIVALGGINTFVAGLIAYLKSRNQPNRTRQFRVDLRRVCDAIDDAEADFLYADLDEETRNRIQNLRDLYQTARNDAEANYPDSWVSTAPVGDGKLSNRVVLGKETSQLMESLASSSSDKARGKTVAETSEKEDNTEVIRDTSKHAVEKAAQEATTMDDSITPAAGPKVPPEYENHELHEQ